TAIINMYLITRISGSTQGHKQFYNEVVWDLIDFVNDNSKVQFRDHPEEKKTIKSHKEL
ncbi:10416_t:CDS:1, partial [Scutellospora calospora]